MIIALAVVLTLSWMQAQNKDNQPLVSETDPAYLSCTFWNGHEWSPPTSRSARTPILKSNKGFRAYGEVKVVVKGGSCENITKLYVAPPGEQKFKIVYTKDASEIDGNGITMIGWSPNGDKLLLQINFWRYETDSGYGRLGVVYSAAKKSLQELDELNAALALHFGDSCEYDVAIDGWKSDNRVSVKVLKGLEDDSYEQHFCVNEPILFVFDIQRGTLETPPSSQARTQNP
jgi:hypothetical protein